MVIRITRSALLPVYQHDMATGEDACLVFPFRQGSTYLVGEVSPLPEDRLTVFELVGFGFCEMPDEMWTYHEGRLFRFDPDADNRN